MFGTSRDAQIGGFANLVRLGVRDRVPLESMAANDFRSVLNVLRRTDPQEIYNLAGQSSVGLSFEQPVETLESIAVGTINLLEAIDSSTGPFVFTAPARANASATPKAARRMSRRPSIPAAPTP